MEVLRWRTVIVYAAYAYKRDLFHVVWTFSFCNLYRYTGRLCMFRDLSSTLSWCGSRSSEAFALFNLFVHYRIIFFSNLSHLLSEQTWALSAYSTLICLKFRVQVINGINVGCNCGFHVWVINLNLWCIFTVDTNIFDISCFSFLLSQLERKIRQPFLVGEHDYIPGVVRLGHGTYWLQLQIISWFLRCVCVCVFMCFLNTWPLWNLDN